MIHEYSVVPLCGVALSGMLAMGCFLEVEKRPAPPPPPIVDTGTLTVRWTVNNRSDPRACAVYGRGATDFELLVYEDNDQVLDRYAHCEDFALSVDLQTGRYTGYATLVEQNNQAVTSTLPMKDIEIVRDTELKINVDFPAGSFL